MARPLPWLLAAALLALVVYLTYPLGGKVWSVAQISRATVGSTEVPQARYRELWSDLKRGTNSKCPTPVELMLHSGERVQMRLDPPLARKYEGHGCGS